MCLTKSEIPFSALWKHLCVIVPVVIMPVFLSWLHEGMENTQNSHTVFGELINCSVFLVLSIIN